MDGVTFLEDCVAANPADSWVGQREADRRSLPLVLNSMVPKGSVYVILPSQLDLNPDLSELTIAPVDFDINRVMAGRIFSGHGILS